MPLAKLKLPNLLRMSLPACIHLCWIRKKKKEGDFQGP